MILIVEDDHHKLSQILDIYNNISSTPEDKEIVDNVRDAVHFLINQTPGKIILDMSLPSHKALPGQGAPLPLPTGGIEVLFELMDKGLTDIPILILTQYPDIEVEDEPIPIADSAKTFEAEYGFTRLEASYYDHVYSANWKEHIQRFLSRKE